MKQSVTNRKSEWISWMKWIFVCMAAVVILSVLSMIELPEMLQNKLDGKVTVPYRHLLFTQKNTDKYAGNENLQLWTQEIYEYDENGNRTACYQYDKHGRLEDYTLYYYDSYGNRACEISWDSFAREEEEILHDYLYNEAGELIEDTVYYDGKLEIRKKYRYYDGKTAGVTLYYDEKGEVSSYNACIFNEDGEELCRNQYDENGIRTSYIYRKYDGMGRCVCQLAGKGETDENPMKKLVTEWDDENYTSVETLYEPLGHVNSSQQNYFTEDWVQTRGLRYEYNEGDLRFCEYYQADMCVDSSAGQSKERFLKYAEQKYNLEELEYFKIYQYDRESRNVSTVLDYSVEGLNSMRILYRYEYNDTGALAVKYTYGVLDDFAIENADGSSMGMSFREDGSLESVERTDETGKALEEYKYDEEGVLTEHGVYE